MHEVFFSRAIGLNICMLYVKQSKLRNTNVIEAPLRSEKLTYHIDYANELEIKHDFNRFSLVDSWVIVFVVVLK